MPDKVTSMEKDKAIELAGGVRALSELLDDITTQAIYAWVKVPPGRIYELRVKRPEWFTNPTMNLTDASHA